MNWIKYQLALMPKPYTILHIGAGLCSELPDYQQIDPSRIILIEPNPETINALRQKTADCDNVTILQAAVAAEAGRAQLRRFNFPELDSLREPTGLYQLLPGLQRIGQTEVPTISPAQLIRRLNLEDATDNWLVLEAPGEETAILEELNRIEALQNFSRVIVRAGAKPFYEGDSFSGPVLKLLKSFGYFAEGVPDESDADWPCHHLRLDRMALACKHLKAELAEAREAHQSELKALREQLSDVKKAKNETAEAKQQLFPLPKLQNHLKTLEDKNAGLRAQLENLTTQLDAANERAQQHQAQAEKVQADLSLALRLQMLRENDLKELQTRYGEVLTIKDEQQDLLTQLHHRLSRATDYLQLVKAQSDDQRLPDELLEALTGKGEKSD